MTYTIKADKTRIIIDIDQTPTEELPAVDPEIPSCKKDDSELIESLRLLLRESAKANFDFREKLREVQAELAATKKELETAKALIFDLRHDIGQLEQDRNYWKQLYTLKEVES